MPDKQLSDFLPLPLDRPAGDDINSAELPLTLDRAAEELDAPTVKTRRVSGCFIVQHDASHAVQHCIDDAAATARIIVCDRNTTPTTQTIARCDALLEQSVNTLHHCAATAYPMASLIDNCSDVVVQAMQRLQHCAMANWYAPRRLIGCTSMMSYAAQRLRACLIAQYPGIILLGHCDAIVWHGRDVQHCQSLAILPPRTVPCEYYPVPEPPPPPPAPGVCGIPPPSDYLPLPLDRDVGNPASDTLPLPLVCWRDPIHIAISQKGYIMHHTITVTIDDQPADPITINLSAGMDGYCWQGNVELPPADFARLDLDNRQVGNEPIIHITIDGYEWRLMLEDGYRDNRRHAAHGGRSYSVPMRSLTARIGEDYAATKQGIITAPMYARQIADAQLEFLPFTIREWRIADWLVPANTYAVTGKTPLAVIGDIAAAAGGYIESHRTDATISIKPRWENPAWSLGEPMTTIPATAVISASGQKRLATRCNGVRVIPSGGGTGGHIYRSGTDTLPRAADLIHPLYTDQPVWIAAGKAALSDTGKHKDESIELPLSKKHGIPLAVLGQVWRIHEPGKHWDGVITDIAISVKADGSGAPVVRQNLTIDRYMEG